MSGLMIRPATPADAPALAALAQESMADAWSEASFAESLAASHTFALAAWHGGALCGYGVAWTIGDEGEIAHLAVAPARRGQGIGTALLRALLDECRRRGAATIFLEVRAGNTVARRLYERGGFVPAGLRRGYYADGEDAVILRCENF